MLVMPRTQNRRPGAWKPCHPATEARFTATLWCPQGHEMTLSGHAVTPDGTVSPSVVCPQAGCPFHAFVRLDGWADRRC